jgi:SulP family sulfate permease
MISLQLDPSQDVFALGTATVLGAVFQSYVVCASLSRSAVLADARADTNMANLVQVVIVVLVVSFLTPVLEFVSRAALAAVVVASFASILSQLRVGISYWNSDRLDFATWALTLAIVLVFDIEWGLVGGLAAAALSWLWRRRSDPAVSESELPDSARAGASVNDSDA